jgi:tetratricopeptide (TPR) repeat protein
MSIPPLSCCFLFRRYTSVERAIGVLLLAVLRALLGNHEQALTYCQQALTLLQGLGNRSNEANTWDSLGYAHHYLGHHTQAVTYCQQALDLYRDLGHRYGNTDTLIHLGDTHHTAGDRACGDQTGDDADLRTGGDSRAWRPSPPAPHHWPNGSASTRTRA